MLDWIALEIGRTVLGGVLVVVWLGGAIAGGDYLKKHVGKRTGDAFSVIWGVGD
jgi:hypothetical protein